jgi:CAAX protease family protein
MWGKIKPSLWVALGITVVYVAIIYAFWAVNDLDYDAVVDTVESIRDNYAVALMVGAAFLVISISAVGWWRPAVFERERVGPWWLWIVVAMLPWAPWSTSSRPTGRRSPARRHFGS